MKRPLFAVCLAVACLTAAYYMIFPPSLPETGPADGADIYLCGRIYKKEYRASYGGRQLLLYLSDISDVTYSLDTNFNSKQNSSPELNPIQEKNSIQEENSDLKPNTVLCYIPAEAGTNGGEPGKEPEMGSTVWVSGTVSRFSGASNPGGFDTRLYYASLGIDCALKDGRILWKSGGSFLGEWLWQARNRLSQKLDACLGEKEASVLRNILLGDKETLDKDIKELYRSNGISHILAISGLHISVLGMGLYRLLRRAGCPVPFAAAAGALVILLYALMTGAGVSAYRAAGMFLLHMLAELLGRTYDMLTAAGVMLVLMLLGQPLYLFHSGFLLSFAAVFGIGCLYPAWFGISEKEVRYRRGVEKRFHAALTGLKQSAGMGISILLATLPVQLWHYYELPVYATLLNLLVLPLMPFLLGLGILAAVFPSAAISRMAGTGIQGILWWFEKLCTAAEKLPGHTWNPGRPSAWQIFLYLAILAAVLLAGKRLSGRLKALLVLGGIGILAFRLHTGLSVTVLDVDQGECICIRIGGSAYLVDGGSTGRQNTGEYDILPFLKYYGITHIQSVFITHTDKDHYNGILELLEKDISIGKIVLPAAKRAEKGEDANREEILKAAGLHNVPVHTMSKGTAWQESGAGVYCLHPAANFSGQSSNEESLALYLVYEGFSMLLTGDIEGKGEEQLTRELERAGIHTLTVLKTAHHGSRYSTSEAFLKNLSCSAAVISCGKDNSYGHPHEELLDRLKRAGTAVYSTPRSGAITIRVKNGRARIVEFRKKLEGRNG